MTQNLYLITFAIAIAVFVLVEGLLIWITLRYRRRRDDDALPSQFHGSNVLEILWTIVPAIIVTGLFVGVVTTLNEQDATASQQPGLVVDATGFQWQWTFDYPDQGLSFTGTGREGPVMAVPTNEVVRIRLHASDVIHSFYVPQFLYKQDAVPGRVNEFDVIIEQPGTYGGQCAEFCGLAHADMHFTVQAMPRAEFDEWVTEAQQQPTPDPNQPTPAPDAPTIELTSISVTEGFDPSQLTVPADQPFTVNLTNADQAAPHDFAIRGAGPDGGDWQGDPDAPAGGSATYNAPAVAAGSYEFYCSIHPNMVGTLTAE
jgi:cytochrome c oxidase subunit 2